MFLLALFLLGQRPTGADTLPDPGFHVLRCPSEDALCRWRPGSSWIRHWSPPAPGLIADYWQSKMGDTVILLRGHADPGRIILLNRDGSLEVTRQLFPEGAMQLSDLTTEDPEGSIVICGGRPGSFYCDTWIHRNQGSLSTIEFPANCIFPRFLPSGRALCLEVFPKSRLRIQTDDEGRFEDEELPFPAIRISKLNVLSEESISFVLDGKLNLWDGENLREVCPDQIFDAVPGESSVYFSGYAGNSLDKLTYHIGVLSRDGKVAILWQSADLLPTHLAPYDDGLLVDLWDEEGDYRKIVAFRPSNESFREYELWSGNVSSGSNSRVAH